VQNLPSQAADHWKSEPSLTTLPNEDQGDRGGWLAVVSLLAGLAAAAAGLIAYERVKVDPTTFDLDPAMIEVAESWNGIPFTGSYPTAIKSMLDEQIKHPPADVRPPCIPTNILWLGNSQLHFIENFEKGQHAAPFLLREALDCPETTVPLAVSLPHANLQEDYVLYHIVRRRLPVSAIIIQLSFDDLREDGLREDLGLLLEPADRTALKSSALGLGILTKAESQWQGRDGGENAALTGFLQKKLEDSINAVLTARWQLWADRKWLRTRLYVDIYEVRNVVLGIRPTTIRKLIPQRYADNMSALGTLLQEAAASGIRVIPYIAPIRQDLVSPYDHGEYLSWKQDVARLALANGSSVLDLAALVPATEWPPASESADFNHFKVGGHKLLANALLPAVKTLGSDR
jgi:hypothetical protein